MARTEDRQQDLSSSQGRNKDGGRRSGKGSPCSTCSTTLRAFLAAHPPMDTWSSVAALVDKESTEDGWHKTLFSDTEKEERK